MRSRVAVFSTSSGGRPDSALTTAADRRARHEGLPGAGRHRRRRRTARADSRVKRSHQQHENTPVRQGGARGIRAQVPNGDGPFKSTPAERRCRRDCHKFGTKLRISCSARSRRPKSAVARQSPARLCPQAPSFETVRRWRDGSSTGDRVRSDARSASTSTQGRPGRAPAWVPQQPEQRTATVHGSKAIAIRARVRAFITRGGDSSSKATKVLRDRPAYESAIRSRANPNVSCRDLLKAYGMAGLRVGTHRQAGTVKRWPDENALKRRVFGVVRRSPLFRRPAPHH